MCCILVPPHIDRQMRDTNSFIYQRVQGSKSSRVCADYSCQTLVRVSFFVFSTFRLTRIYSQLNLKDLACFLIHPDKLMIDFEMFIVPISCNVWIRFFCLFNFSIKFMWLWIYSRWIWKTKHVSWYMKFLDRFWAAPISWENVSRK